MSVNYYGIYFSPLMKAERHFKVVSGPQEDKRKPPGNAHKIFHRISWLTLMRLKARRQAFSTPFYHLYSLWEEIMVTNCSFNGQPMVCYCWWGQMWWSDMGMPTITQNTGHFYFSLTWCRNCKKIIRRHCRYGWFSLDKWNKVILIRLNCKSEKTDEGF